MMRTEEEIDLLRSIVDQVNDQIQESGEDAESAFMATVETYLSDSGDIDGYQICNYMKPRYGKINGYDFSETHDTLSLFITDYSHPKDISQPDVTTLGALALTNLYARVERFFELCLDGYYQNFEQTDPVWGIAHDIYLEKSIIKNVRLYVLTSSVCKTPAPQNKIVDGRTFSYRVWDLVKISRVSSSGTSDIQEVIDLETGFGGRYIPCLPVDFNDGGNKDRRGYDSYLAIVPGDLLADLYEKYKQKLLQKNVRAFLQVTGKINKGIQVTIAEDPSRFFAYNNGLSATASYVDVQKDPYLGTIITKLSDFQIVNGGQTTASIHYAAYRKGIDVSSVYVQMKLTVIRDQDLLNELVPNISRYANTQNKVSDADLFANVPFHVELEKHSRNLWTPLGDTHWYYERSRGQYKDELGRQRTPAAKKKFKAENPPSQKLLKTDVSKYENIWNGYPHIASLGGEKSFNYFTTMQDDFIHSNSDVGGYLKPDRQYFCDLVAKAILYRTIRKMIDGKRIHGEKITGYQQQLCTYTLAYLIQKTDKRLDLDSIWKEQRLQPELIMVISRLLEKVYAYLTHPPARWSNIGEFCKRPECWSGLLANMPLFSIYELSPVLISKEDAEEREKRLQTLISFEDSADTDSADDDDLFSETPEDEDNEEYEQKSRPLVIIRSSDDDPLF